MRIRKQITDLTNADLAEFPIWELAIDEEGEEGQDEETVKPRPDLKVANPRQGVFVVRTAFVASDGTQFDGYAFPSKPAGIGYVQPTVITTGGQVSFWFGMVGPREGVLERSYQLLGKDAVTLFPLRYRSAGGEVEGELSGFMHYEAGGAERIVTVT